MVLNLYEQSYHATKELIAIGKLSAGDVLVVGCSTSEVSGEKIGSASKPELAEDVFMGIWTAAKEAKVYLAAQCCEHLNRAIIIEKKLAKERGIDIVNVVPQPKAGGSFATKAYEHFECPVAVEHIKAERNIMELRFGFISGTEKTQKEVADMLRNITKLHITLRKENY